jgi:uncharacterized radical SAM protein YgiQ
MEGNELIKKESKWLPISSEELSERAWDTPDIIIVSGDAYVDHPSFGHAVIARVLEHEGYRVAVLPQPNWRDDLRDFKKLGRPRLFFGVSSGCMDSMVNHYTANRRRRSDDAYTPGGKAGFRPDYAVSVYSSILKRLYPDTPVIIGGVEASLRRYTHYDYWSDSLRSSVLEESGADMLVYGMGEKAIRFIARGLAEGKSLKEMQNIPQTAYLAKAIESIPGASRPDIILKSHAACESDKRNYAANFALVEKASNRMEAGRIVQEGKNATVVVNPPFPNLEEAELDAIYSLPFTRMPHPRYSKRGSIPAWEMIRNSLTIHRGCFGGCAFCTISAHQGKFVQSRSEESILQELEKVVNTPGFNGVISDLGGPSANMYRMQGITIEQCMKCSRASCLYPETCSNLDTNHLPLLELYRKAQKVQGVKHLFIGSGIRYDLFMSAGGIIGKGKGHEAYVKQLVQHHVSGRLKVAPEHCSPNVLSIMRKPSFEMYKRFKLRFDSLSLQVGKKQQLIPYFISSHPGSRAEDMALLAIEARQMGYLPEQTQDFTPTPMTLATVMYYTGLNPYTLKPVFVPKADKDKRIQQKILYWYKKENIEDVRHYLLSAKRADLAEKLYGRKGK